MGVGRYIPDEDIERVKNSVDIVNIIEGYVPLTRKGGLFKACCPFHEEKTPSFTVFSESQTYQCFGANCPAGGGDVIKFVKEIEKMTFYESVKHLADRANIQLNFSPRQSKKIKRDDLFKKMYKQASEYYHERLFAPEGTEALEYLLERVDEQTIKAWKLGYSPKEEDLVQTLIGHLINENGYSESLLLDSGLARKHDDYIYDFFKGRVIFPIRNERSEVVAFGGRVLGDEFPKYINSAQSSIFNKSNILFGLDKARTHIRDNNGEIIVFEGYVDEIAALEKELTNCVATLGVALTIDHIRLLKKFDTEKILLCLDPDDPGMKSAIRIGKIVAQEGLELRIIDLSKEGDPADYFKQHDADDFQEFIEKSKNLVQFGIKFYGLNDSETKSYEEVIRLTRELYPIIDALNGPLHKRIALGEISKTLELGIENLVMDYNSYLSKSARKREQRPAEELLLGFLTANPIYRRTAKSKFKKEHFSELEYGWFFNFICEGKDIDNALIKPNFVIHHGSLFAQGDKKDLIEAFEQDCQKKGLNPNPDKLAKLEGILSQTSNNYDNIMQAMEKNILISELRTIDNEIKELDRCSDEQVNIGLLKELLEEYKQLSARYEELENE